MASVATLPLIAALREAMHGPLERFTPGLAGPDDTRMAIGIDRLMDAAMVYSTIALGRRTAGLVDTRAAISVWTLGYFETVLPMLLSANILLDRMPCVEIDQVEFIVSSAGYVTALKVSCEQPLLRHDRFRTLVEVHLSPFIDRVASRGGITTRVVWSNAGHIIEAFLGMIKRTAAGAEGLAHAHDLLASSHLGSGSPNPLFRPVRYSDGKRFRRVCCLRFLTPSWAICAICPLGTDNPARANRIPQTTP